MIPIKYRPGRMLPLLTTILLFTCFILHDAAAQNTPPGPATPPKPGNVPAPPSPVTPGRVKEGTPTKEALPKKGPNRSLEELELSRKRRLERLKRLQELTEAENQKVLRVPPVLPKLPWPVTFQPHGKRDLDVYTSWKVKAVKGKRPFTLLTVKIKNRTSSYLSMTDLLLDGEKIAPLDATDPREIPVFPFRLNRFRDSDRLPAPVRPRDSRTLTFTLPFALEKKSTLNALAGKYFKFIPQSKVDWEPVRIIGWDVVKTRSRGHDHQGLIVTVENRASYPVNAKLTAELEEATFAGGETLFQSEVSLLAKEKRRLIFRSIPDEGVKPGSLDREARPDRLRVRTVTISDIQF